MERVRRFNFEMDSQNGNTADTIESYFLFILKSGRISASYRGTLSCQSDAEIGGRARVIVTTKRATSVSDGTANDSLTVG